jgi:hypothetical protein
MQLGTRLAGFFGLTALLSLSACAATGPCQRKDDFFATRCGGSDVSYRPDPTCEAKIERCSPAQRAQLEGYVRCLETQNQCSLDAMARCAEQFPGGVNLSCG